MYIKLCYFKTFGFSSSSSKLRRMVSTGGLTRFKCLDMKHMMQHINYIQRKRAFYLYEAQLCRRYTVHTLKIEKETASSHCLEVRH